MFSFDSLSLSTFLLFLLLSLCVPLSSCLSLLLPPLFLYLSLHHCVDSIYVSLAPEFHNKMGLSKNNITDLHENIRPPFGSGMMMLQKSITVLFPVLS